MLGIASVDKTPFAAPDLFNNCKPTWAPDAVAIGDNLTAIADGRRVYTWNGLYDVAVLTALAYWMSNFKPDAGGTATQRVGMQILDAVRRIQWIDGLLLWKRIDMNRRAWMKTRTGKGPGYSLAEAVDVMLPSIAGYKESTSQLEDLMLCPDTETSQVKIDRLTHRNQLDCVATLVIGETLYKMLPENERVGFACEQRSILQFAESWVFGLRVDRNKVVQNSERLIGDIAGGLAQLPGVPYSLLNSPKQLATWLYQTNGLTCKRFTDKGNPQVDKVAIAELAREVPWLKAVQQVNKASTRLEKYCEALVASCTHNGSDRTHSAPRIAGAYTGRCTYSSKTNRKKEWASGASLHQWAREKWIRSVFIADAGMELIELDFSGQELREVADDSGDPALCAAFNATSPLEQDVHAAMGSEITGVPVDRVHAQETAEDKEVRDNGKRVNLSSMYRIGADSMSDKMLADYDVYKTTAECKSYLAAFKRRWAFIPPWWAECIARAKRDGYAETKDGRKVGLTFGHGRMDYPAEQTAINFRIQGTAAGMKYLALYCLYDYCLKHSVRFCLDLHDGLFFQARRGQAFDHAKAMQLTASNLPYDWWGWQPKVPFPVDAKIGLSWGELRTI